MSVCDKPGLLGVDEAVAQLLALATPRVGIETTVLEAANGRVLAQSVVASADVPAWDNSAMDGYAFAYADAQRVCEQEHATLPLTARVAAGDAPATLSSGHAARIFTGAPLPAGADTVVAQEDCQADSDTVRLLLPKPGSHVRQRGEELRAGESVLQPGVRLQPSHVGLLAALGYAQVSVYQPLRVGLMITGSELQEAGSTVAAGAIHDSNGPALAALLTGWGMAVERLRVVDDLAQIQQALQHLAARCDVIVSSGGVSVGEEDHVKTAVRALGELNLWRLAIQPGKPFAFGQVAGTPWLGLPGNPVSTLITAMIVAKPYLRVLQGGLPTHPKGYALVSGFTWAKAKPRRQYLRALVDDQHCLQLLAQQSSSMLTSMAYAQGLAIIEAGRTLSAGDRVLFLPQAELLA